MPLGHPSAAPITLYGEASISPKLFTKLYSCSLFCIPNHQSAFCWIYLLFLTRSIIRSSCPPSHHWTSLGFHFAGLNPISLDGLSGWPGEGRYPKAHQLVTGVPQGSRFLDPSSSSHTLHHWVPSYRHMASPTIATLMTHSSISHFDQMIQR